MSNRKQKYNQTVLEVIIIRLFKILWFLITLPFKGLSRTRGLNSDERAYLSRKKSEIEALLGNENLIELKHAVMEADKLVDFKLKALGARGVTFADRLRGSEQNISKEMYNNLWQGHKVRNMIAHEHGAIPATELKNSARKLLKYIEV